MLRLSTRARYALRGMIELAGHEGDRLMQLREVAELQYLSPKYLEQLAIPLRRAGLIRAERGSAGGYRLARPASEILALDIVQAVEGPLDVVACALKAAVCERSSACAARRLWIRVHEAVISVLAETTLAELRNQQDLLASLAPAGAEA